MHIGEAGQPPQDRCDAAIAVDAFEIARAPVAQAPGDVDKHDKASGSPRRQIPFAGPVFVVESGRTTVRSPDPSVRTERIASVGPLTPGGSERARAKTIPCPSLVHTGSWSKDPVVTLLRLPPAVSIVRIDRRPPGSETTNAIRLPSADTASSRTNCRVRMSSLVRPPMTGVVKIALAPPVDDLSRRVRQACSMAGERCGGLRAGSSNERARCRRREGCLEHFRVHASHPPDGSCGR